MRKSYVKKRHKFYFALVRPIAWAIAKKYHFTTKPLKLKKGEQYLILANHQGVMDPVFLALSFKAPVYIVANDFLFNSKLYSAALTHCFAPIKKKKGAIADVGCIKTMCQVAKEGGNIALFPEGNRAWCDFQFYIDQSICKLIRLLKLPVILYNFHGGYGVNPRWSDNIRKGVYEGAVKKILTLDELNAMDDDTLYREVVSNLKVIDSDSGKLFTSRKKAEFLERELFVCPKCHGNTLHSHGNEIVCADCNLTVTYNDDLTLTSNDSDFTFRKLVDWYKFQQEYVKNYQIKQGETIFTDSDVVVYDISNDKRTLVGKGEMTLTSDTLRIGEFSVSTKEITNSSVTGGRKINLNTTAKSYFVIGPERFNPIKYLLFFNILCEHIYSIGGDKYYGLSITDADS